MSKSFVRLISGEGSALMALLRGAFLGLLVGVVLFGLFIILLLLLPR